MKRFLLYLILCTPCFAQLSSTGNITATGSTCATTNACIALNLFNSPTVSTTSASIVVTGTFSATLQFEASTDGITFASIPGGPLAGGSAVTSITGTGTWNFGIAALNVIRVRASAYTSGTATVTIQASAGGGISSKAGVLALFGGPGTSGQYLAGDGTLQTASTSSGTVTSVATTSPITGGPITGTGTIACATCGVTGSPLSQFAATTSAQLFGIVSDETGGAGVLVGSSNPSLAGATISGASGALTFANGMTVTNLTGSPNSLQVAGGNINITSGGVTILSLNVAGLQATNGGYIYDTGIFYDSTTSAGTSGCPLTSTGSAVLWNCSPTLTTLKTATNCSSGASPAVCAAASSGSVALPTGTNPTLVVNTTAVTANSQILLTVDESLGTKLGVTCNTTLSTLLNPVVTARTAATSFTFTIGAVIASNPACVSYTIIN